MGLFSLFVSIMLVSIQFTSIVLNRDESAWSFYLLQGEPDTAYWRPALDRILAPDSSVWPLTAPPISSSFFALPAATACLSEPDTRKLSVWQEAVLGSSPSVPRSYSASTL